MDKSIGIAHLQQELKIILLLCHDYFFSPSKSMHDILHNKDVYQETSLM